MSFVEVFKKGEVWSGGRRRIVREVARASGTSRASANTFIAGVVASAQVGDEEAFTWLFEYYKGSLGKHLYRVSRHTPPYAPKTRMPGIGAFVLQGVSLFQNCASRLRLTPFAPIVVEKSMKPLPDWHHQSSSVGRQCLSLSKSRRAMVQKAHSLACRK